MTNNLERLHSCEHIHHEFFFVGLKLANIEERREPLCHPKNGREFQDILRYRSSMTEKYKESFTNFFHKKRKEKEQKKCRFNPVMNRNKVNFNIYKITQLSHSLAFPFLW